MHIFKTGRFILGAALMTALAAPVLADDGSAFHGFLSVTDQNDYITRAVCWLPTLAIPSRSSTVW